MIIICDTREQRPFSFERWGVAVQRAKLPVGDYALAGLEHRAAIERKELNDLVGCLQGENRERFERELSLARMCDLFVVVVEGSVSDLARGNYRSNMQPESALQSVAAFFTRYSIPFLFADTRSGAEYWTFSLLSKHGREIEKQYKVMREMAGS
jgi:ERCC4-type nuclease